MPGTTKFEQKGKKKDQTGADLYSKGKGRHKKTMGGGARYGMMHGGEHRMKKGHGGKHNMPRAMYGHGGFASISDMEKACSNRTGRNTMRQKYEEKK